MNAAVTIPVTRMLSALFAGLGTKVTVPELGVSGLSVDSRLVKAGDCFFALNGAHEKGISFAAEAIRNGAVAVAVDSDEQTLELSVPVISVPRLRQKLGIVAARFYGEPSENLEIIAITGTNGKTTVAHICAQALTALGKNCGYIGTLGVGEIGRLTPTGLTTPDPVRLQSELAGMLASGKRVVALEASSHALAQFRLAGTRVRSAVFTGLGHDHLDYHASRGAYFEAKQTLFAQPGLKHAVLNADDPASGDIVRVLPDDISLTTFSLKGAPMRQPREARLALRSADYTAYQSVLELETWYGAATISSTLIGDINAQNLLASLGVLLSLEIPLTVAASALSSATPVCGRLERYGGTERRPLVFIDYAHSPDSLERVLMILRGFCRARVICVFGCGGDRDRSKRPLMGQIATQYADEVILTTDNPRSEDPELIAREIIGSSAKATQFAVIHDRALAIEAALCSAAPDDIVLIAGKGHETVQEAGGLRLPQSDQSIVQMWLADHP